MKRNFNVQVSSEKLDAVREKLLELAWMPGFPAEEKRLNMVAKSYAKFIQNRQHTREDFGEVNDLDWLVDEIADTLERFPAPIKAREIYEAFFTPEDGRYSDAMGAAEVPE